MARNATSSKRIWRGRVEQPLFAVVGCFIWIPLTLAVFNAFGADIWVHAPDVVYWFAASGFVCVTVVYGVVWGVRKSGSERVRAAVEHSFVGRSVCRAQQELAEIAEFGQTGFGGE